MANKYESKTPVRETDNKTKKRIEEDYQFRADSVDSEPKIRYALPHELRHFARSKNYTLSQSQGTKNKPTVKTNGDGEGN